MFLTTDSNARYAAQRRRDSNRHAYRKTQRGGWRSQARLLRLVS